MVAVIVLMPLLLLLLLLLRWLAVVGTSRRSTHVVLVMDL